MIWLPALIFAAFLFVAIAVLAVGRSSGRAEPILIHGAALPAEPGATELVDLNYATRAELEALPGIGQATAAGIISRRAAAPIRSLRELVALGLLSESQRAALLTRAMLTIRPP